MANTTGQVMPDGSVQYYEDAMGRAMVSTDYDPTSSYAVGDYCIYDNVRYCCNTAIASGGETWNSAHWDEAKVDDDISEIKSSLSNLKVKAESLINFQTITSTAASYNTYNSRKFSDYDFIIFQLMYSADDIRETKVMPKAQWTSGKKIVMNALHGSVQSSASNYNVSGVEVVNNGDMSVSSFITGAQAFKYLTVYGLKLG